MIAVKTKDSSRNAAKYNKTAKTNNNIKYFIYNSSFTYIPFNILITYKLTSVKAITIIIIKIISNNIYISPFLMYILYNNFLNFSILNS